jgi:heme-degrading monooxygenase HmoA
MEFEPSKVQEFLNLFNAHKLQISSQPGCTKLELLRDIKHSNVFVTYSYWHSETDLNNYRNSELFSFIWPKTKVLFNGKPQAWSVNQEWTSNAEEVNV